MATHERACRKCKSTFCGRACKFCAAEWRERNREATRRTANAKAQLIKSDAALALIDKTRRATYKPRNSERKNKLASLRHKRWRDRNPEKSAVLASAWRRRNPDWMKKVVSEMKDHYIAKLIGLAVDECPAELIELKRMQIETHRQLKEMTK